MDILMTNFSIFIYPGFTKWLSASESFTKNHLGRSLTWRLTCQLDKHCFLFYDCLCVYHVCARFTRGEQNRALCIRSTGNRVNSRELPRGCWELTPGCLNVQAISPAPWWAFYYRFQPKLPKLVSEISKQDVSWEAECMSLLHRTSQNKWC